MAYAAAVRRIFPSVAAYEATLRTGLASALIERAAQAAAAPAGLGAAIAAFRDETRSFDAIALTVANLPEDMPEPTEAELEAHLAADRAAFAEPERRDAVVLRIDPAALAADVEIPEAGLRAAYDARRAEFETPETRTVDQIVYPTLAEAEAAAARLAAGEADFDALLAERGLSRSDAGLGAVTEADLRGARGAAAFALPGPGVAGPAQTSGGFALLEVTAIAAGRATPFEAVRETLRAEAAAARVLPEADCLTELAADALAGGATIEEAAAELGLAPLRLTGLSADGGLPGGDGATGIGADPAFLSELFAAREGADRDPVRLRDGGSFALRVTAVAPPRDPGLEEIRGRVAERWAEARRAEALTALGEAARARVAGGEPIEAVAADLGLAVSRLGPMRRDDPDPRLDAQARAALFAAPVGAAALSRPPQRAVVAQVAEVIAAGADGGAEVDAALADSIGDDQVEFLGRALEAEAGVTLNQQAIEAVLAQIGA